MNSFHDEIDCPSTTHRVSTVMNYTRLGVVGRAREPGVIRKTIVVEVLEPNCQFGRPSGTHVLRMVLQGRSKLGCLKLCLTNFLICRWHKQVDLFYQESKLFLDYTTINEFFFFWEYQIKDTFSVDIMIVQICGTGSIITSPRRFGPEPGCHEVFRIRYHVLDVDNLT